MVRFLHFTTQLLFSTGVWLPQRPVDFFSLIGRDPFRGRSCTRHCNKGCQTIMLAFALNISYYFSVLSLGLYLNYTHVSYFTVVSPITCLMRSRRIQRRTIRIIFPNFKYSSALREAGIPALYDRREKL